MKRGPLVDLGNVFQMTLEVAIMAICRRSFTEPIKE